MVESQYAYHCETLDGIQRSDQDTTVSDTGIRSDRSVRTLARVLSGNNSQLLRNGR